MIVVFRAELSRDVLTDVKCKPVGLITDWSQQNPNTATVSLHPEREGAVGISPRRQDQNLI